MTASAILAAEGDAAKKMPGLVAEDTGRVEHRIDEMESGLEPLRSFILPGGHPTVSQSHVARTVCRRAERAIVGLEIAGYCVPDEVSAFVNRLSDYFFVLSRKAAKDFNILPKKWIPVVV